MEELPARAVRLVGSEKAHPKAIRIYGAITGWPASASMPVIGRGIADDLRRQGSTSVEVKWRFHTHQFSLLDMKLLAPGGGTAQPEPKVGQPRRGRGMEK